MRQNTKNMIADSAFVVAAVSYVSAVFMFAFALVHTCVTHADGRPVFFGALALLVFIAMPAAYLTKE